MNGERLRRALVVAREEYRRAIETRWLFGFAALFASLVLGLSFFGLSQSGDVGFTSFARVTLSLLNLVLFLVPLVGLLLGVTSVTSSAESLGLLLAQPVSRTEVLMGKFAGLTAALTVSQALGLGGGGVVVALNAGTEQAGGFAMLACVSLALGALMVATGLCVATLLPDRLRATGAALAVWLLAAVAYDLAIVGGATLLRGVSLQAVLLPALFANPVDLARVLVTLAVGQGALFGPTSAALVRTLGQPLGVSACLGALAVQAAVPLLL